MRFGSFAGEIFMGNDVVVVTNNEGKNIEEFETEDKAVDFCLDYFGEDIVFVKQHKDSIMLIHVK